MLTPFAPVIRGHKCLFGATWRYRHHLGACRVGTALKGAAATTSTYPDHHPFKRLGPYLSASALLGVVPPPNPPLDMPYWRNLPAILTASKSIGYGRKKPWQEAKASNLPWLLFSAIPYAHTALRYADNEVGMSVFVRCRQSRPPGAIATT